LQGARASRRYVGFCLALFLFGACGGRPPGYLPLDPGWWWYYETVTDARSELVRGRAYVTNEHLRGDLVHQSLQAGRVRHLRATPRGVVHVIADPREAPREALVVPGAPKVGFEWTVDGDLRLIESRTFSAEDRLQGRRLPFVFQARVAALDATVLTPAGEFRNCLHVGFTGTRNVTVDRGTLLVEVSVRHEAWYAAGVGLVKATREETAGSSFLRNGHYTQTLLAFGRP